jgi:hypothetical protein
MIKKEKVKWKLVVGFIRLDSNRKKKEKRFSRKHFFKKGLKLTTNLFLLLLLSGAWY